MGIRLFLFAALAAPPPPLRPLVAGETNFDDLPIEMSVIGRVCPRWEPQGAPLAHHPIRTDGAVKGPLSLMRSKFCVSVHADDVRFLIAEAPSIDWHVVLVITRIYHDHSVPSSFHTGCSTRPSANCSLKTFTNAILENSWVRHVFPVFWVGGKHPKVTPIGIGYGGSVETIMRARRVAAQLPPLKDRPLRVYSNFQLGSMKLYTGREQHGLGPLRERVLSKIKDNSVVSMPTVKVPRDSLPEQYRNVSFEVCPPGNGVDTCRVWIALTMGSIPLVSSTPLDPLYEDLPVVIVKDWDQVTTKNLEIWKKDMIKRFPAFGDGSLLPALSMGWFVRKVASLKADLQRDGRRASKRGSGTEEPSSHPRDLVRVVHSARAVVRRRMKELIEELRMWETADDDIRDAIAEGAIALVEELQSQGKGGQEEKRRKKNSN